MNGQQFIEKCARLEFGDSPPMRQVTKGYSDGTIGVWFEMVPVLPFDDNREDLGRVVALLDDDAFTMYGDVLTLICATDENWANQSFEWNQMQAFKATAEQMREALEKTFEGGSE